MALGLYQSGQVALDIGGSSLVALHLTGQPAPSEAPGLL